MNYDYVIGQGDFEKEIRRTLEDENGDAVDLTDVVGVTLELAPIENPSSVATYTMSVSGDPTEGVVVYQWDQGETDTAGFFLGRIIVEYEADEKQSFPNSGYLVVYVTPEVGYAEDPPLYVAVEELKASAGLSGKTYRDLEILRALRAASRGVEIASGGQRFYVPESSFPETRYYTPRGHSFLEIDFATAVETVSVGRFGDGNFEEEWGSTHYVLDPLNATSQGRPYERILWLKTGSFRSFPRGVPRSVRVEGNFGWETVPAGIVEAVSLIATKLVLRKTRAPFGVVAFGDQAAARIARTDPDVVDLMKPYVRDIPIP